MTVQDCTLSYVTCNNVQLLMSCVIYTGILNSQVRKQLTHVNEESKSSVVIFSTTRPAQTHTHTQLCQHMHEGKYTEKKGCLPACLTSTVFFVFFCMHASIKRLN